MSLILDISALRGEGRLVQRTLPDGGVLELVERAATVTGFDAETRAVEVLASDASEDRYGDVIEVSGWQLERYDRNPIVLIDHDYRVRSLVGTAQARAEDGGLRATITLDDASLNPDAGMVQRKIQAGSLKAVSVGFLPLSWEYIRDEQGKPTGGIRYLQSELLEISFVPVPANAHALLGNHVKAVAPAPELPAEPVVEAPAVVVPGKDSQMENTIKGIEEKLASQGEQLVQQGEWLKKVEDDLARARRGSIVQDNLREAIPVRMLGMVEQHVRAGAKDPILAAAKDAWFKNAIKLASGQFFGEAQQLREENERLVRAMGEVTRATINENTATQGGNLVPSIVEAEIIRLAGDASIVRPLVRKVVMTSKTHTVPSPGSVTAYVVAESGATMAAGEPQIGVVTLTTKTFEAYGLATFESVQDSVIGVADMFATLAAEAFGAKEDQLALEGTAGAAWVGLAAASNVNSMDATSATNTTAIPTYTQIVKMIYTAEKKSSRRRGAFVFHPIAWANIAGQVSSSVPAFNGVPGFTALDPTGEADGRVGAYPVYCTEQIDNTRTDVGGTDASYGYFGDFNGMLYGDRTGIDFLVSPHVKFAEGLIAMRMLKRTAMVVALPKGFTMIKKVRTS